MNGYTVGRLARAAGVGADTVRHYEEIGLLPPALRAASGYRYFAESAVARLEFIRRSRLLGFSLPEVQELLDLSDRRQTDQQTDMVKLREVAAAKLADVERKLVELERMKQGLQQLVACCPGKGRLAQCPILSSLASPNGQTAP